MSLSVRRVRTSGSDRPLAGLERALFWLLIALPGVAMVVNAVSLVRHGVDIPFWDDWRQYDSGDLGNLSLAYLFTPANDTLYPVGRLLDSLAVRLLDGHSVAYQLISLVAVLGGLLALQWRLLSLCVESPLLRALAFSFTLPMLQADSYWGLQNLAFHQAIPLLCVLGILLVTLSASWNTTRAVVTAGVLSAVSGLTYVSGAFAVLGLGAVLLAASRCLHIGRARMKAVAWAALLPGLLCTLAQVGVIALVQEGVHRPDTAMAFPWEADFWWYSLGKVGRALMLNRHEPLLSALVTIAALALLIWVFSQLVRHLVKKRRGAGEDHPQTDAVAVVLSALIVVVALYLGLVAAGRAHLRPESVQSGLQLYRFGFERFHFFWVTLLWPWLVVGVALVAPPAWKTTPTGRRLGMSAAVAVVLLMAGFGDSLHHAPYYRAVMGLKQQGVQCLNDKIGRGEHPLACPTLHPTEPPKLLPDDLTTSIRHALAHEISFTERFFFPHVELGAAGPAPLFRLAGSAQGPEFVNLEILKAPEGSEGLLLRSTHQDPNINFATGQQAVLRQCAILDVVLSLELPQADRVQVFFVPMGETRLSETNSRFIPYSGPGRETLTLRLVSPRGFADYFRVDPGSQPGELTLDGLELRCRF